MVAGALGPVTLGVLLIPLRSVTTASNLAFVFVAFTVVVAEVGGRSPALVAALVSALSLDFFLTQPYLRLTISGRDDIIAFFGLAACGLIAAAFGRRRKHLGDIAGRARWEMDVLERLAERLKIGTPLDEVLDDLRRSFRLELIVLRDGDDRVVAAAPTRPAVGLTPTTFLSADTLVPFGPDNSRVGVRGVRLPEGGGRLGLRTDRGPASLDLWEGDAEGFSGDEGRTLVIAGSILGLELSRRQRGSTTK
jgi:hypothetical protein